LAPHQKKQKRLNAHIVFLDESGLLLAPLVRRTWAPRGRTPILSQPGRYREKASIIGALSVSPKRRRVAFHFSVWADRNVDGEWLAHFVRELRRQIQRPIILVWDRLNVHRSRPIARMLRRSSRLYIEFFPPYAPELNPVEGAWAHLKMNPLANLAPEDALELADIAERHVRSFRRRKFLLKSFIRATPLFLRL
jgi:transposase